MAERITIEGIDYDLVVQRELASWIVAEADGTVIYSRHDTEAEAESALQRKATSLRSMAHG